MVKKSGDDAQLSFDFEIPDQKIKFIIVKGICRCGHEYEFKKADIVLEMTARCPGCGGVIAVR